MGIHYFIANTKGGLETPLIYCVIDYGKRLISLINRVGMCANSVWLLQRALPVILLTTIPQFTQCNSEVDRNRLLSLLEARSRRAPFNSWAGKRSSEEYGSDVSDLGRLEGLQHFYLQQLHDAQLANDLEKRAPFNSWAGKRAPFNAWAGKRSSEESNELLNHGDDRFGDSSHSHRVKRSSGEYTENENDQNTHVRIARGASGKELRRRVRSNTAFSAWGGR